MTIKYPCNTCKGEGIVDGNGETIVHIPKGSQAGEVLVLKEKGHESYNGKPGDLHIKVDLQKGQGFWQEGEDINSSHTLTVAESVLGTRTTLSTMYGDYKVELSHGLKPGDKIAIKEFGSKVKPKKEKKDKKGGQGQQKASPKEETEPEYGNHYVHINIKIPSELTEKEKELYRKLALFEGSKIDEALSEESVDKKIQIHDLNLIGSPEYRNFLSTMEAWKRTEETDVYLDEKCNATPNQKSLNDKLKRKMMSTSSTQPN